MTHEEFVQRVMVELNDRELTPEAIQTAMHIVLHGLKLSEECTDMIPAEADTRATELRRFLACKMVEGCTKATLNFYSGVLKRFMLEMPKPFDQVKIDDVRYYIAVRGQRDNLSKASQDNELRVLKSFFAWASANGVSPGNPAAGVKCIKAEKRVKKPFSAEEQEMLRIACQGDLRTTALLEVLLSTGCRVGEIHGMNRDDVNGDEIVVFGKGQKERRVFLNARAQVALRLYLQTRDDDNPALFAGGYRSNHHRLAIGSIESMVRELGARAGIRDVHPHKFRRTAATTALRRGMPIEQVQQMLGHESIATTLIYAKIADDAVKQAHKRLM